MTYLLNGGCGNPDPEAAAADGRDDLASGVAAEDDSAGGHVLLHCPPESMLGIFSKSVHLCEYHNCGWGRG